MPSDKLHFSILILGLWLGYKKNWSLQIAWSLCAQKETTQRRRALRNVQSASFLQNSISEHEQVPQVTTDVCHRNTSIPVLVPHPCVCSDFCVALRRGCFTSWSERREVERTAGALHNHTWHTHTHTLMLQRPVQDTNAHSKTVNRKNTPYVAKYNNKRLVWGWRKYPDSLR